MIALISRDQAPPELRELDGDALDDRLEVIQHSSGVHGLRDTTTGASYYVSNCARVWRRDPNSAVDTLELFDGQRQQFVCPRGPDLIADERMAELRTKRSLMEAMRLPPAPSAAQRVVRHVVWQGLHAMLGMLPIPSFAQHLLANGLNWLRSRPRPPSVPAFGSVVDFELARSVRIAEAHSLDKPPQQKRHASM